MVKRGQSCAAERALFNLEEEDEVEDVTPTCTKLKLQCAVTFGPLTDPAKFASCTHPARCNYSAIRGRRACPSFGCAATLKRCADLVRDESLRAAIAKLPVGVDSVVLTNDGRVRRAP